MSLKRFNSKLSGEFDDKIYMSQKKHKICLAIRITFISRLLLSITAFSIMADLIPGISDKSVFAQSTVSGNNLTEQNSLNRQEQAITTKPKPEFKKSRNTLNRDVITSTNRGSISIKSTDAIITSRIQQPLECTNCGVSDFIGYDGQSNTANYLPHWIINGVIMNKVFKWDARKRHTADVDKNENTDPYHHFNSELTNHFNERRYQHNQIMLIPR